MEFYIEKINLNSKRQKDEVKGFLENNFNILYKDDVDLTLVIRDDDENIIATASRDKDVFKYFGVCSKYQGENLTGKLLNELISESFRNGIFHWFIFTKPDNTEIFKGSGFNLIAKNNLVSLLESGNQNINEFISNIKKEIFKDEEIKGEIGAIVMNLNPFTLGHRYLIEEASKEVDKLIVFVVQEDSSVFSFKDRIKMAKEGTKDLENVIVVPGGKYLISRATFPTYFLKEKDSMLKAYTKLDAQIFSDYYAKKLNITKRFMGEEPLDEVTRNYNESVLEELTNNNITLKIIKRKEMGGEVISASKVRKYLIEGDFEKAYELVPSSTKSFLQSSDGIKTIERLREK